MSDFVSYLIPNVKTTFHFDVFDLLACLILSIFLILTYYVINFYVERWQRLFNYPPGPTGLPIVGYIPFLSKDAHLDFNKIAGKYGNVFSLRLGQMDVVVLNEADAIREAFSKPEFLGRPSNSALARLLEHSPFFIESQEIWREHRRFVVQAMKDLGLGKTKIEIDIQDEIECFLKVLESSNGHLMDPRIPLSPSMSNNISALTFGKRMDYNDPTRKSLDEALDLGQDAAVLVGAATFFPWSRYVPFLDRLTGMASGRKAIKYIYNQLSEEIRNHKETLDPRNIRDFIDSYLVELKQRQKRDSSTTLSDDLLIYAVLDLFGAGSETVRTTLHWFIYVIAAHPEVQKKVQQEIQDVVGTERKPEYLDHKMMPFTQAVILEIMRWKSIVPINLPHYTVADTSVKAFDIPQGVIVLANLWAVHHDPKLWENPDEFIPERFLSKDGRSVVKSNNFMVFSYGKRSCPGENMAMMETFLYFTSILQRFDVSLPKEEIPSYPYVLTTVLRRENYKAHFKARRH